MSNYSKQEIKKFLRDANRDLGSGKYKGSDMIPDYCKTVLIAEQLQAENKKLKEILESSKKALKGGE